jgi:hypothetical protein
VVSDDERVEDTLDVIEKAVCSVSEIDLKVRLPEPIGHEYAQVFLRLKRTSPYLFLDVAAMKRSSKDKFLQFAIHGKPVVHFDKINIVKDEPVEPESHFQQLRARLEVLKKNFDFFQVLVMKELNRGNAMEALSYYLIYTYRPLVEILRIKHSPWHYKFFTTYIYYEMPPDIVERLHCLYFISDTKALRKCQKEAETWFWEIAKSLGQEDLKKAVFTRKS